MEIPEKQQAQRRWRGRTALIHAAFKGDVELSHVLLKKGAKRDTKDATGKTALDYALQQQQQEVVKVLE